MIPLNESGMFGTQKSGMQFSIKEDGRWASGEVVQNRMAVTGRPTVVDTQASHKELQRATKSGKTGISVWPHRMWLRRLANEGQQVTPVWLAAATDPVWQEKH